MAEKVRAGVAERRREAVERLVLHLGMARAGEASYPEARRRAEELRRLLQDPSSAAQKELDRVDVEVDLSPQELYLPFEDGQWALWLVECEGWGWLGICGPVGYLAAMLAARLEIWGTLSDHEASARPLTGQIVRVPEEGGKAAWWAWAAQQEKRLLIAYPLPPTTDDGHTPEGARP